MLRDIVNKDLVTVSPDTKIREVASLMDSKDVGAILVVENNKPRGIITDRDIVVRCLSNSSANVDDFKASDLMTESVQSVNESEGLFDCIRKMHEAKVRRMPVVDKQGNVVGIISQGDLLAILARELNELARASTPMADQERPAA